MSIGVSVPHTSGAKATSSAVPAKAARKTASAPRNSGRRSGSGSRGARAASRRQRRRAKKPRGRSCRAARSASDRRTAASRPSAQTSAAQPAALITSVGHERRAPPEPHEPRHEHEPQRPCRGRGPRPGSRPSAAPASGRAASPITSTSAQKRSASVTADNGGAADSGRLGSARMPLYDLIADLPLEIEAYALDGRERRFSPEFVRAHDGRPAPRRRRGGARRGRHLRRRGPAAPAGGRARAAAGRPWTLDSFSRHLGGLDLFGGTPPACPPSCATARWAFESAARGPGAAPGGPLARRRARARAAAGRASSSPSASASRRAPSPSSAALAAYPGVRFKLDATPSWDDALIERLAATGAVASIDFKGAYKGTPVDVHDRPALYTRCAEAFPDAWLEDPDLTVPEADAALAPYRDRITWDAPIHGVAGHRGAPVPPALDQRQAVADRLVARAARTYEWCAERASSPTAAASPSSTSAAARSSTSPRSSTATSRTTSRRAATTGRTSPRPACRPARCAPDLEPTGFRRRP